MLLHRKFTLPGQYLICKEAYILHECNSIYARYPQWIASMYKILLLNRKCCKMLRALQVTSQTEMLSLPGAVDSFINYTLLSKIPVDCLLAE